ncbi:MAG: zinc ribbon domain-containing protein [Clostridia bacterium]|nr:zinc ribbon domain-containing protein [Clostridia bacterium]
MKHCPNCNKPLPEDALFCGDCGTAAETIAEEAAVAEEAVVAEEIPAVEVAPIEEVCAEEVPAAEKNEALSAVVASAKALLDKVPKKILKIAGAVLAAVILLVVIISLFSGGTPDHALYVKDGELIYSTLHKGGDVITDEPSVYAMHQLSADGDKLFFVEEGDLYWCSPTKPEKAQKIAGDVSHFLVNEKGDRVTYQKEGNLYQSNLKDSEKIASDVEGFVVTKDGKKVFYQSEGAYYVQKVGKDKRDKLGSSDSIDLYHVSEDLEEFYFTDEDKLYVKKFNKDRKEIARDVTRVVKVYDNGDAYYITEDEDGERSLYFYNGNKSELVYENVSSVMSYAAEKPVLMFMGKDGDDYVKIIASKDKTELFEVEDAYNIIFSEDGKKLYYQGESDEDETTDLYETKVNGAKAKEGKQIDEDVYSYTVVDGKVICRKEYNEEKESYELWVDGKRADSDVVSITYDKESGKIYYKTDDGSFKVFKSKAKKIYDDVDDFEILPGGQVLFLYDVSDSSEEGDLYMYKGSGKAKKLDDSVSYIVPVYSIDELYEMVFASIN